MLVYMVMTRAKMPSSAYYPFPEMRLADFWTWEAAGTNKGGLDLFSVVGSTKRKALMCFPFAARVWIEKGAVAAVNVLGRFGELSVLRCSQFDL
jgi:hypothetical protein